MFEKKKSESKACLHLLLMTEYLILLPVTARGLVFSFVKDS